MIRAIYIKREDGDFDFVAAFDTEQIQLDCDSRGWPDEVAGWLENEGETVLMKDFCGADKLTDILVPDELEKSK